jgi:ribonuclease D
VYLVDPLAGEDMGPIGELFGNPSVVKVIQGSDYDILSLDRAWGFRVRNLYDTHIAAQLLGLEKTGLPGLTEALLGVQITKDARLQKSDWSRRPLEAEALQYAAADVQYLIQIREILQERLGALGRETWVAEECSRIEQLRYVAPDPETAFLSVKGSSALEGQQLAVLRRLHLFRESEALRLGRPPYYILPDPTLVELASDPLVDLTEMPSLRKRVSGRFGRLLRQALQSGVTDPPVDRRHRNGAEQMLRPRRPPTPADRERLQRLKRWRAQHGSRLSLEPGLLWPMASLERLAREPHALDEELESPRLRQWQREQFAESLAAELQENQ